MGIVSYTTTVSNSKNSRPKTIEFYSDMLDLSKRKIKKLLSIKLDSGQKLKTLILSENSIDSIQFFDTCDVSDGLVYLTHLDLCNNNIANVNQFKSIKKLVNLRCLDIRWNKLKHIGSIENKLPYSCQHLLTDTITTTCKYANKISHNFRSSSFWDYDLTENDGCDRSNISEINFIPKHDYNHFIRYEMANYETGSGTKMIYTEIFNGDECVINFRNHWIEKIIAVVGMENVKKLDLTSNNIGNIDELCLDMFPNLQELWLSSNYIENLNGLESCSNLVNLKKISVSFNNIIFFGNHKPDILPSIEEFYISENYIQSIPLSFLRLGKLKKFKGTFITENDKIHNCAIG
jgi:Leucine-rich repeat (LRR) protein